MPLKIVTPNDFYIVNKGENITSERKGNSVIVENENQWKRHATKHNYGRYYLKSKYWHKHKQNLEKE